MERTSHDWTRDTSKSDEIIAQWKRQGGFKDWWSKARWWKKGLIIFAVLAVLGHVAGWISDANMTPMQRIYRECDHELAPNPGVNIWNDCVMFKGIARGLLNENELPRDSEYFTNPLYSPSTPDHRFRGRR